MSPKTLYWIWVSLVVFFVVTQGILFLFQPNDEPQHHYHHFKKHISSLPHYQYKPNPNTYQKSCSDLFGDHQLEMVHNGTCMQHSILNWVSCNIGTIRIDTSKIIGSVGGEPIDTVMNRKADTEFLNFTSGSLLSQRPVYGQLKTLSLDPVITNFLSSNVVVTATAAAATTTTTITRNGQNRQDQASLLVRRPAYANPCHALISMYNVYLVKQYFLQNSHYTLRIVWLDGHAKQKLDDIWGHLFQTNPIHVRQIDESNNYLHNAIIVNTASAMGDEGIGRYGWEGDCHFENNKNDDTITSPSTSSCKENSTLRSFRDFVLGRYKLSTKQLMSSSSQNGDENCRLTLLVRRDYVAHPRSNGRTDRTLANIKDDLDYIRSEYPNCKVIPVSFEEMDFKEQLKIISNTDILIAVHGAGNIHVLFLPQHALFVEYFPKNFLRRRRFQYLAECLGIKYQSKKAWIVETFPDNKVTVRLRPAI